ncbi:MAG: hypothetical protein HN478_06960, partial [Rhodospirillaceae bacterium]|nr:hypothetical protein [Rhodospirillaceae bacterium]
MPASALSQAGGFGSGGGVLGDLMDQLQILQGTGAIDTLGSRAISNLDISRQKGAADADSNFQDREASGRGFNLKILDRQGALSTEHQILAKQYCRGQLTAVQSTAVDLSELLSPLEKDYCQRASELLLQYGYGLFGQEARQQTLSTGAIFPDYVLGVDDELVVTFIGRLNQSTNVRVDRKGRLLLPDFKPIFAAGHTFGEVRQEIAARTAAKHLGTEVYVSLGAVRIVKVMVIGEVQEPGRKYLTALSTVVDALRLGGGIKKTGSVRRVKVQRGDQVFWIDAYDLLFSGMTMRDLALRDGDRIIIPPLGPTYALAGDVKRAGIYEMPEGRRSVSVAE